MNTIEEDVDQFLDYICQNSDSSQPTGRSIKDRKLLATGRFGTVYLCTAGPVKLVVKQYTKRSREAENEFHLVKELQHHRIIKYLHLFSLDTSVIIAMKRLTTLRSLLKQSGKPFSEQQAVAYGRHAAEGLLYLHKRTNDPVVHRAIRCSHLLLNDQGELRIGGFFLARPLLNAQATVDDANLEDFVCESTPPEILSAKPHGLPVDIWQLGYALLEMLTGDGQLKGLEQCSAHVHRLVLHLLSENPSDRPTIGKALASMVRMSHELGDPDSCEVEDSTDGPKKRPAPLMPIHKESAATALYGQMKMDNQRELVLDSYEAERSPSAVAKGESALHLLCRADSKTDDKHLHLKSLLAAKEIVHKSMSKVTKPDKNGQTPMHVASVSGNVEMVKMLVENSDFLPSDHDLQTPIHAVARNDNENDVPVVEALLEHVGGDSDLPTDADDETPLQTAARYGNTPVAEALLRRLASGTVEQLLCGLEQKSVDGETALLIASSKGYVEIVRLLLDYGADPNVHDAQGTLPHEAAVHNMNLEVMKALLDTPVPACDKVSVIPATKETLLEALETAKSFEDVQIVELLENALSRL